MSERLILASASPRRRELLLQAGLTFDLQPSGFSELDAGGLTPAQLVLQNALGKAKEVADRLESGIVLGADTVVVGRGQVLGKPTDRADARRMLQLLSDGWHEVLTGIALVQAGDRRQLTDVVITRVHMRSLTSAQLEAYLDSGEPYDKAGAYGIQGRAGRFIDRIEGCYFNVVGLPLSRTTEMLDQIAAVAD